MFKQRQLPRPPRLARGHCRLQTTARLFRQQRGEQRVLRGGSWDTSLEKIGATHRHSEDPGYYDICFGYDIYGFRIVRSAAASRARP